MQRITSYALLGVVSLAASVAGQVQAPQTSIPQATVRELATIEGLVGGYVMLPDGRTLIYASSDDRSTFTYDIATKRRTLLGTDMIPASVSRAGDRLAFSRSSEDGTGSYLWTMPIDRTTGLATGEAQRVSLRPTVGRALFSPDGEMLVFSRGPRPDGTWDVAVVPATGGAERVVANYSGRVIRQAWSADGQALYVETLRDPRTVVERVPVAGGRSEPLVPRTVISAPEVVGLSPDARVAFFNFGDPASHFSYRTSAGVEGEIAVPLPPHDRAGGYTFTLDSRLRHVVRTHVQNQSVRVLDLNTGQARDLVPGVQTSEPAWSPDGRRIAVLTGPLSHRDIIVMNADGSGQRRYPLSLQLKNGGSGGSPWWPMPWSPDGRFLAFRVKAEPAGRRVADRATDRNQLAVLDLNSGQTRVLGNTAEGHFADFSWRSDGNALTALKATVAPDGSATRWSIVEIPLNSTERLLRDISVEFPNASGVDFSSGRAVIVRLVTGAKADLFLVPLDRGTSRRLADPGAEPGSRFGIGRLIDGQLFLGQVNANGEVRVMTVQSIADDSARTLRVPFRIVSNAALLSDGRAIVLIGRVTGDSMNKLFLVPLNGSPPRSLGEIPRGTGGRPAPSPDGKFIAYTSDGPVTTKIHQIDFAPALQAILKR